MRVTIYGFSDDLIEVEGDLWEEFGAYDTPKMLLFSDGTELRIEYTAPGLWRITDVKIKSGAVVEHRSDNYGDVLTLEGDFQWVECWPVGGPTLDGLVEWFDDTDASDWACVDSVEAMITMYRLAKGHGAGNLNGGAAA